MSEKRHWVITRLGTQFAFLWLFTVLNLPSYQDGAGSPTFTDFWNLLTGNLGVIFLFVGLTYALVREKPLLVPGWVHRDGMAQKDKEYDRMVEQKNKEAEWYRSDRDGWKALALDHEHTAVAAVENVDHAVKTIRRAAASKAS